MSYILLGLAALVLGFLAVHGFVRAKVIVPPRQVRFVMGLAMLAGAGLFTLRGSMSYALPLAILGAWLVWEARPNRFRGRGGISTGQTSRVATDHLEMELDHITGAMRGRVLKGVFAGRDIRSMAPAELALLWQDCRYADLDSAQLIEAYLDRVHPTWREDMARAEAEPGAGGIVTREEAFRILGLQPDASDEDIRQAHRELMLKLHPDRGGSSYLAAKINEAKAVLLRRP
ncbi:MAG: DnaJ domain-containing protein [Hyphomicrobiaceae bacterium]